jgi:patatin-like phospholipase/acyl hydrolase
VTNQWLKVLSIDGGGARGLIPVRLLEEIETQCQQPIHKLFDVIAGTSTGAVVSLMLTKPQPFTCAAARQLYAQHAKDFFSATPWHRVKTLWGWVGPKYPTTSPKQALQGVLGTDTELKDAVGEVVIPIYDITKQHSPDPTLHAGPRTFSRADAKKDPQQNFRMLEVALAATSAPTYFPCVPMANRDFQLHPIDGAVYLNNPAGAGISHAMRTNYPEAHARLIMSQDLDDTVTRPDGILVLSLGTGWHEGAIVVQRAAHWGKLRWASPLFDVMIEAQAEAANMIFGAIPGIKFVRLQPILGENVSLDDVSQSAQTTMLAACDRCLRDRAADIKSVCDMICGKRTAPVSPAA